MKSSLLLLSLCLLASCGPGKTGGNAPLEPEIVVDVPVVETSISSQFTNTNAASRFPTLDFRLLTVTGKQPSSNAINCDGTLGNSGKVNGIDPEEVRVTGDEQTGTIEYGHLAYVGATNYAGCRAASKEAYTYSISGDVLTLCNVNCINGVYAGCASSPCETYTKQ